MAAQRGKDILIKLRTEAGALESVAGLRAARIALSAGAADATCADAPGRWRQLLAGAGAQSCAVSGAGVFKDAAADAAIRAAFFAGRAPVFQLVIPDFGVIEGPFQIATLEYSGNHDSEARFEISLESAGALGFTEI